MSAVCGSPFQQEQCRWRAGALQQSSGLSDNSRLSPELCQPHQEQVQGANLTELDSFLWAGRRAGWFSFSNLLARLEMKKSSLNCQMEGLAFLSAHSLRSSLSLWSFISSPFPISYLLRPLVEGRLGSLTGRWRQARLPALLEEALKGIQTASQALLHALGKCSIKSQKMPHCPPSKAFKTLSCPIYWKKWGG